MANTTDETFQAFRAYLEKISHYDEALALLEWDSRTGAPKKGADLRAESRGTIGAERFRLQTSQELGDYLVRLNDPSVFNTLSPVQQAIVRVTKRDYDRDMKIPADRNRALMVLTSQAESVWETAREKSDFEMFRPYLEKIVEMKIEFAGYLGDSERPYDALLDLYEPGMTTVTLDSVFGQLRESTVKLVQDIVASGRKPDLAAIHRACDVRKQRELSESMLKKIGYDFSAGRLDETIHPFETTINRHDNRVTTRFVENDITFALFSTIHEGGHALYEQGISDEFTGTPLAAGTSMGIHESQSRFYENMIGRSLEFWEHNYAELLRIFPIQFADLQVYDFYRAINAVEPSLIRIESDEVTYNLHIMIRYEIEKGLIHRTLKVKDLPEIWRAKMKEYLGVEPKTDAQGVLQDVHWSGGDFGYFPTYALGNLYAAQFRNTLLKEIPDAMSQVRQGNMMVIRNWLKDKIHQYGSMLDPKDIVRRVTGEDLNGAYLAEYLNNKYRPLYGI